MTDAVGFVGPVRTVNSRTVTIEPDGRETPGHSTVEEFDVHGRLTRRQSRGCCEGDMGRHGERSDVDHVPFDHVLQ
jgi:hypothetical protein